MRYFIGLFFLLFFSCGEEKENNTNNYIPKRPINLTYKSQWYGGLDGGLWFTLSKLNNKEYRVENYFENGKKHWDAIYTIDNQGFDYQKLYTYIHPTDYSKCTIQQKERIFVLVHKKDIFFSKSSESAK